MTALKHDVDFDVAYDLDYDVDANNGNNVAN